MSSPGDDNEGSAPLKAALLTTYKPPDTQFLVEFLLPELLGMQHSLSDNENDYYAFQAELVEKLTRINDRITIISSMNQEIDQNYPWLCHYMNHLTVGSGGSEVQHAKLWLLHRGYNEKYKSDTLEMCVSSANLTMSALKEQIQAAWRTIVPLSDRSTQGNLNTWGVLPEFLNSLGKSSGDNKITNYFFELLKRAKAPEDVTFLASIPGNHSDKDIKNKLWGSGGLKKVQLSGKGPTKIRVFTPYLGIWDREKLDYWIHEAGGENINDLTITWINKDHLWATENKWQMSDLTFRNLMNSGVIIKCLPNLINNDDWKKYRLHDNQLQSDEKRWSHAKVYELQRGNDRRIIITSANFSPSAWGIPNKNELHIKNFEFGVAISKATKWALKISSLENLDFYDAWIIDSTPENQYIGIAWVQVTWDGEKIVLKARTFSSDISPSKDVIVCSHMEKQVKTEWKQKNKFWIASIGWNANDNSLPNFVKLTCESKIWTIAVIDQRLMDDISNDPIPGIDDPEKSQEIRDAFLLEQYGGKVIDFDILQRQKSISITSQTNRNDDYRLPSFIQAREWFGIVDNWTEKFEKTPPEHRDILKFDGKKLIEVFRRKEKKENYFGSKIAANLVADEIEKRIKG